MADKIIARVLVGRCDYRPCSPLADARAVTATYSDVASHTEAGPAINTCRLKA